MPRHSITVGTALYLIKTPDDHPMGVDWYHPHPHVISTPQILYGMSGVIAIVQVADYFVGPEKRLSD